MSNDKGSAIINKKKRKQENMIIDSSLLETLNNTYISVLNKPSSKFPKAKFVCKICPYHMDDVDRAIKHAQDNIHKRNINKLCTKNLLTYLPNPTPFQLEAVNECLENTLNEPIFIDNDEYMRRIGLCMKMNELAREINPGYRLIICGSLLYGLSLVTVSDVNLYLEIESADKKTTGYLSAMEQFCIVFKKKLQMKAEIKFDKSCSGLFCKDKQGITYHISASNRLQHLNSELIRLYLKIDSRAENLAKLFRYFAHKAFIDQIQDGLFPSEAFSILVIFYLQQLSIPILPNLHKLDELQCQELSDVSVARVVINDVELSYVNGMQSIKQLWNPPVNDMSLGELWIGLLKFYVVDFNSNMYMVSIRCTEPVLKSDRHIVNRRLAIEDPFDIKRNILFRWNSPEIIDFLNDQLQGCFIYFAVPQLKTGPIFKKVNFVEISLSSLKPIANVTPIFTKDNFTETIDIIETDFKKFYTEQKSFYDVSKWPVELFVKNCLLKILSAVFNSDVDIKNFVCLLELKTKGVAYFLIENYVKFKEYAVRLSRCVLQEFSDHFQANDSWAQPDFENRAAFELIKKSSQKFINESLNILHNDDDDDDELEDLPDSDNNEIEEAGDREFIVEDVEEIELLESNNATPNLKDSLKTCIQITDSWKLPIAFKQIYVTIKGNSVSSNNPDEYNEDQVDSLRKQDLVYSFNRISIHNKKLIFTCGLCNTKGHRKEICSYAIPRYDEYQDILESIDLAWLVKLRGELNAKFKSIVPNNERPKIAEKLFDKITEIVKSLYPTARPQLFGSTINGFMTKASDLDVCLEFYVDDKLQSLSNNEVSNRLKTIGRELKKLNTVHRIDYILKAKVPIIKFYMKTYNIQGDISINNSLGLQNTKMLKVYADLSPCVKILGNLIKYVAKTCEIGDASQGTLSSYAYMLMLIHFLQKRGILPILQELYEGERPTLYIDGWDAWYQTNITTINKLWNKKSNCNNNIEYLWLDFFYYYAVEFDIDREVATIRQSSPLFKIDKNWQSAYMAVEDPFNLSHNLCGSLSLENSRYILECFAHILKLHSNSDNLNRPDAVHYMLLEPGVLRPPNGNIRVCFNCNKPGHVARDCVDKGSKRTPTKAAPNQQQSLPSISAPLQFKPSNVASRVYLQLEVPESLDTENVAPFNIPLKAFKADVNQFSVCPISIKFGENTVIVPMLVGKNDIIEKKLNAHLKNGLNNNVCVFPVENIKQVIDHAKHNEDAFITNNVNSAYRRQDHAKHNEDTFITNNVNSAYRRQTPIKNDMTVANNLNKINQQHMNRNQIVQHNMPTRMAYDMSMRMIYPQNNLPRYPMPSIPPGFQYQPEQIRYGNPNWNYQEVDNRRMIRTPLNNNHTPRGNRK